MKKLLVSENVMAVIYLAGLVYAVVFSTEPVAISAVFTCIFSALYIMTGDIKKECFGKTIYKCTIPAVLAFSIYFFWAAPWVWPVKLVVGVLVGFFVNVILVYFAGFNEKK